MSTKTPLSSKRWVFTYFRTAPQPDSAFATLLHELPHLTRDKLNELLYDGAIYLNGKRIHADTAYAPPARIELFEPKPGYRESMLRAFSAITRSSVVYLDENLMVIAKPAGLPTLPTRDQINLNLATAVKLLLKQLHISAAPHLPSRLDAPVSGLVPIGLGQPASRNLQRSLENGATKKKYIAVVKNVSAEPCVGDLKFPIAKERTHAVTRVVAVYGKPSHTEVLAVQPLPNGNYAVLLSPHTGRTHQLRIHCAHAGFPIVGDMFYGDGKLGDSLHLCCVELALPHPISGLMITARIPQEHEPSWKRESPIKI